MSIRYLSALVASGMALALALVPAAARAQSVQEHIGEGDSAYAAQNETGALSHYEAAIAASDSQSYDALWKASRSAVDLAEFNKDKGTRTGLYEKARADAARAVAVNPDDAMAHFQLARALGRVALSVGVKERVKYATDVRKQALAALAIDSTHAGALHIMGVWNAEIMRLSGFSRFMAKNFLGGKVFEEASWDNARKFLKASIAAEPKRIVHHLDLARVYADTKEKDKAREQYRWVLDAPATEYNDEHYKAQAREELAKLK